MASGETTKGIFYLLLRSGILTTKLKQTECEIFFMQKTGLVSAFLPIVF